MSEYKDFSSLPPDEERQFVPFEEASQKASSAAMNTGRVLGLAVLVVVSVIVLSFPKPEHKNPLGIDEEAPEIIRGDEAPKAEAQAEATDEPSAP